MKKVFVTVVAAAAMAFCMTACNNNSKNAEAEQPSCDTTAVCEEAHECAADSAACCKADSTKCCKAEGQECCKKAEGQKCEGKCDKAK